MSDEVITYKGVALSTTEGQERELADLQKELNPTPEADVMEVMGTMLREATAIIEPTIAEDYRDLHELAMAAARFMPLSLKYEYAAAEAWDVPVPAGLAEATADAYADFTGRLVAMGYLDEDWELKLT